MPYDADGNWIEGDEPDEPEEPAPYYGPGEGGYAPEPPPPELWPGEGGEPPETGIDLGGGIGDLGDTIDSAFGGLFPGVGGAGGEQGELAGAWASFLDKHPEVTGQEPIQAAGGGGDEEAIQRHLAESEPFFNATAQRDQGPTFGAQPGGLVSQADWLFGAPGQPSALTMGAAQKLQSVLGGAQDWWQQSPGPALGNQFSDWWYANQNREERMPQPSQPSTPLEAFTDLAMRPSWGVTSAVRELQRQAEQDPEGALMGILRQPVDFKRLGEATYGGLSGQTPYQFTDILQHAGVPVPIANVTGLGLDIATDPLNLLAGAGIWGKGAELVGRGAKAGFQGARHVPVVGALVDMLGNDLVQHYGLKAAGLGEFGNMLNRYENVKRAIGEQSAKFGNQINQGLDQAQRSEFWRLIDRGPAAYVMNLGTEEQKAIIQNAFRMGYQETIREGATAEEALAAGRRATGLLSAEYLPEQFQSLYKWYRDAYEPGMRQVKESMGLSHFMENYVYHLFPDIGKEVKLPETMRAWLPGSFKTRMGAPGALEDVGQSLAVDRAMTLWAKETKSFIDETLAKFGTAIQPGQALAQIPEGMVRWAPEGGQLYYIPKEIFDIISTLRDPQEVKGIAAVYDMAMGVWKGSVTSLFPDFHIRNAFSNVIQNWFAGVKNPINYLEAAAIQDVVRRYSLIPEAVRAATPQMQGNVLARVAQYVPSKIADGIAERALSRRGVTLEQLIDEASRSNLLGAGWYTGEIKQAVSKTTWEGATERVWPQMKAGAAGGGIIGGAVGGALGGPVGAGVGAGIGVLAGGPLALLAIAGRTAGGAVENNAKIAHVLGRMDLGDTLPKAAVSAQKFLFDYSALSGFEKDVARRVVPFYTWTRMSVPLFLERFVATPGKFATLEKIRQGAENEALRLSGAAPRTPWERERMKTDQQYLEEQFNIQVGRDRQGKPIIISGFGVPIEALNMLPGANFGRWLAKGASMITPAITGPLQMAMNQSFYTGNPLYEIDSRNPNYRLAKWMFELEPMRQLVDGRTETRYDKNGKPYTAYVANPEKMFLVMLPLGRFMRTGGKLGLGGEELTPMNAVVPYRTNVVRAANAVGLEEPPLPPGPSGPPAEPGVPSQSDLENYHLLTSEPFQMRQQQKDFGVRSTHLEKTPGENKIVVGDKEYWVGGLDTTDQYQFKGALDKQMAPIYALNERVVPQEGKTIAQLQNELYSLPDSQQSQWRRDHPAANEALTQKTIDKNALLSQLPLAAAFTTWRERKPYAVRQEVEGRMNESEFTQFYSAIVRRETGETVVRAPTVEDVTKGQAQPSLATSAVAGTTAQGTTIGGVPGSTGGQYAGVGVKASQHAKQKMELQRQADTYPWMPPELQPTSDAYWAASDTSKEARDVWIKANPQGMAALEQQWNAIGRWKANAIEEGNLDFFDYKEWSKARGYDVERDKRNKAETGKSSMDLYVQRRDEDGIPIGAPPTSAAEPFVAGTPAATAPATTAQTIIDAAQPLLGKPYGYGTWQAGNKEGIDCSAFVSETVKNATGGKVNLTAYTDTMYNETQAVTGAPQPGDLVFYRYNDPSQRGVTYPHVAIYLGGDKVLDARGGMTSGIHSGNINQPAEFRRVPGMGGASTVSEPAPELDLQQALAEGQQNGNWRPFARTEASTFGIDPTMFERQIQAENNFNPTGTSPAGAVGIAQIVPQYHPGVNANDPAESLAYAAGLMKQYLQDYNGDWVQALVRYNGGQGAVDAWNYGQPYAESKAYVAKVLGQQYAQTGQRYEGTAAPTLTAGTAPFKAKGTGTTVTKGGTATNLIPPVGNEAVMAAQIKAKLQADSDKFWDWGKGTDPRYEKVQAYLDLDDASRLAYRSNPATKQEYYDTISTFFKDRDAAFADPAYAMLQEYMAFTDAAKSAGVDRPLNIPSSIEWYVQAKKDGTAKIILALGGGAQYGGGTPRAATPYAPRSGGGGGGRSTATKTAQPSYGSMASFMAEAGQPLMNDVVQYWSSGTPLSPAAMDFLKALYAKYAWGARSFEEWLAYILRSQWALWNAGGGAGAAQGPALPAAAQAAPQATPPAAAQSAAQPMSWAEAYRRLVAQPAGV